MDVNAKNRWNQRYREEGPEAFGLQPSEWLVQHESWLKALAPGTALDLACGNGRNAVYLAKNGFSVHAVDISTVIVDWLSGKASEEQLSIKTQCLDLSTDLLPPGPFQVVINFNFLERRLYPILPSILAPGGLLFFETYTIDQQLLGGNKRQRRFPLEQNELLGAFPTLQVLHYREGVVRDPERQNAKAVASLVAKKPDKKVWFFNP